jgi:hypothetical protein
MKRVKVWERDGKGRETDLVFIQGLTPASYKGVSERCLNDNTTEQEQEGTKREQERDNWSEREQERIWNGHPPKSTLWFTSL